MPSPSLRVTLYEKALGLVTGERQATFDTYDDDTAEVALQVVPVVAVVDTNNLVLI